MTTIHSAIRCVCMNVCDYLLTYQVDLNEDEEGMYGVARSLFISDSDKRKSFCLQFKVCKYARVSKHNTIAALLSEKVRVFLRHNHTIPYHTIPYHTIPYHTTQIFNTRPQIRDFGTFISHPIRVISKPSKKKQHSNTAELTIDYASEICLYSRLKAQSVRSSII